MVSNKTLEYYEREIKNLKEKYKIDDEDFRTLEQMIKSMDERTNGYINWETYGFSLILGEDAGELEYIEDEKIKELIEEAVEYRDSNLNTYRVKNNTIVDYLKNEVIYKLSRYIEDMYETHLYDIIDQSGTRSLYVYDALPKIIGRIDFREVAETKFEVQIEEQIIEYLEDDEEEDDEEI
jgi:hypothetical protein